jgi:hypothetical protein
MSLSPFDLNLLSVLDAVLTEGGVAKAAATDLVATVPASVFEVLREQLDLRTLPFPIPTMMIATNLCWHARTHTDAGAAGFRDIVRRAVAISPAKQRAGLR